MISKKDKWYMVVNDPLSATTTIEGIRVAKNSSVLRGAIVPVEYFGMTPPDRFSNLLGRGDIVPYTPKESELEILYTCYPAAIPKGAKFTAQTDGIMSYQRAWYQVSENVPYGLAALVDIEGICKVGDVAMAGDIVPAKFFAGLTMEQFNRLEVCGLVADRFLESLAPDVLKRFRHVVFVDRYAPDKYELQGLYEKFPAMNPELKQTIIQNEEGK